MYNLFERNETRSIHDPIHGTIKLSDLEMNIIEHPLFKRLHHIRQNSFLYKVFPTAKHTRFDHSIGVMHMAGKMFEALIENSDIASKGDDILRELDTDHFKSHMGIGVNLKQIIRENQEKSSEVYCQIRIASLLHDIGHGPLSHLFDSYAPTIEEFMTIINSDQIISEDIKEVLTSYLEPLEGEGSISEVRIEHEHVSLFFIAIILEELKEKDPIINEDFIKSVLQIIKPDLKFDSYKLDYKGFQFNISSLLNDIVASAPIDCDRMDYLKRDSYFIGVPYGNYSEQRVLKTLLPYVDRDSNLRLGLKSSGLHAVENFLLARYELYVQVYGHKTNEACNAMLKSLQEKKLKFSDWTGNTTLNSKNFQDLYIKLTDESFLTQLYPHLDDEGKETLRRINGRNLWKRVFEVVDFVEDPHSSSDISIAFKETYELLNSSFPIKEFKGDRYPLKDVSGGAMLLEKTKYSYYVLSEKELGKSSQIIESLNKGQIVRRFYTTETNFQEINKMKREVQSIYSTSIEGCKS